MLIISLRRHKTNPITPDPVWKDLSPDISPFFFRNSLIYPALVLKLIRIQDG